MLNNGACRALFLPEPAAPGLPNALPNREEGSPAASLHFWKVSLRVFGFGSGSHSHGAHGTIQLSCGVGSLFSRSYSGAHSRAVGSLGRRTGKNSERKYGHRIRHARAKCFLPALRRSSSPMSCACVTPTVRWISKPRWWPCSITPAKPIVAARFLRRSSQLDRETMTPLHTCIADLAAPIGRPPAGCIPSTSNWRANL